MKQLLLLAALPLLCIGYGTSTRQPVVPDPSPLSIYSKEWDAPRYKACYTAATITYMTAKEKEVIHLLNLLRANPKLFAQTVVKNYPERAGRGGLVAIAEFKSLLDTLGKIKPLPLLYPDAVCYASAQCHAFYSGEAGYVGHDRNTDSCKNLRSFNGECCDYGHSDPLAILMSFLIDEGVPSLGHRWICLASYSRIGVSIQPHSAYGFNAVLDFKY